MSAAKEYVQSNVVTRLTQPKAFEIVLPPSKQSPLRSQSVDTRRHERGRLSVDAIQFMESIRSRPSSIASSVHDESVDTYGSSLTSNTRVLQFNPRLQKQYRSRRHDANRYIRASSEPRLVGRGMLDEEQQRRLEYFLSRMEQSELSKNRRAEEVCISVLM